MTDSWRAADNPPLPTQAAPPFGVYVHVPFCLRRCGYCDFNTYTPRELATAAAVPDEQVASPIGRAGGPLPTMGGWVVQQYVSAALAELRWARATASKAAPATTVFFGGGTPTVLPVAQLRRLLQGIAEQFGIQPDAEITIEANPDTVSEASLRELAAAGFTRISLGMQSAVPGVLQILDRTHDPAAVARASRWARQAGMSVSLDLIYGTPSESLGDWGNSLRAAIGMQPDHLSCYALTVEEGTKLSAQVRRGQLPAPTGDDEADKYELADQMLAQAGYAWYEISNWAREPRQQCRHNLGYWHSHNWWGIGPGAHSHLDGRRWWNLQHPRAYAEALASSTSPAHGHEVLTAAERHDESVMLRMRLATGLPVTQAGPLPGQAADRRTVAALVAEGLVRSEPTDRLVLTLSGRRLADLVVRRLLAESTSTGAGES